MKQSKMNTDRSIIFVENFQPNTKYYQSISVHWEDCGLFAKKKIGKFLSIIPHGQEGICNCGMNDAAYEQYLKECKEMTK